MHRRNGTIERFADGEDAVFAIIRSCLSYLPGSVHELPPVAPRGDAPGRREEGLATAVPRSPRTPYRLGPVMEAIFDRGSVFRYAEYGGATVTALARLDGHPVGVLATDPFRGTTMTVEGAMAVTRLADLCETFHLPMVSLTDQGGLAIGRAAEERGTIRHGARAIAAIYQARVPQAELIVRRVYGVGGAGIINRHRASRSWAWPPGDWGSLPAQGGIEAAFRAQLDAARDRPRAARRRPRPGGGNRADPPHAGRGQLAVPHRRAFWRAGPDRPARQQAAAVLLGPGRLPGAARAGGPPLVRHPPVKAPGAAPPARGKAITGHGNRRAPAGYGGAAAGLERRRCRLRFHRVQVLRSVPHPGQGFTQGVIVADGTVWESTGGYGQSRLLRYRLGADQPDAAARLAPELFGEGICLADGGIWQLTWRERVALRWHPDTLELLETIRYNREGWGICHAGEHVFTSDGSSELVRRDPATLAPAGLVRVRCQGRRVGGLNDLAWSAGRIWANLLGTSHLAGIDPGTGEVADLVDAHAVRERHRGDPEAVLNGIAALPGADEFLLTGKRYRRIYHVRLAGRRRRSWPAALTP